MGYSKFTSDCKPPAEIARLGIGGRVVSQKVQFCNDKAHHGLPVIQKGPVQFSYECVGRETLVVLGDAGLQQQIQLTAAGRLKEQFLRSGSKEKLVLRWDCRQDLINPLWKFDGRAEPISLVLTDFHGYLDSPFPTPLLHVEDGGMCEGFSLHLLGTDE